MVRQWQAKGLLAPQAVLAATEGYKSEMDTLGYFLEECCIIGANSVVKGEIPPCSIAAGAPARVVGEVEGVDARAAAFAERLY